MKTKEQVIVCVCVNTKHIRFEIYLHQKVWIFFPSYTLEMGFFNEQCNQNKNLYEEIHTEYKRNTHIKLKQKQHNGWPVCHCALEINKNTKFNLNCVYYRFWFNVLTWEKPTQKVTRLFKLLSQQWNTTLWHIFIVWWDHKWILLKFKIGISVHYQFPFKSK